MSNKIISFFKKCRRVMRVASKPSKEEFIQSFKISAIGIIILGAIGFIIFLLFNIQAFIG